MNKQLITSLAYLFFVVFQLSAQNDSLKMNQLKVPDNFNYQNVNDIFLDLTFEDLENGRYIYQIGGVDSAGNRHQIAQNFLPENGQLQQTVCLPLHHEKISLIIKNGETEHHFEWDKQPYFKAILSPKTGENELSAISF